MKKKCLPSENIQIMAQIMNTSVKPFVCVLFVWQIYICLKNRFKYTIIKKKYFNQIHLQTHTILSLL